MRNKVKIYILATILLTGFFTASFSLVVDGDETIIENPDNHYNEIYFQQERNLIDHVLTYNLGYLGISVMIIVALIILVNFGSIAPLRKEVKSQAEKLIKYKKELEEKFLKLVDKQEEKLNKLEEIIKKELGAIKGDASKKIRDLDEKITKENKKLEEQIKAKASTETEKLAIKLNNNFQYLELRMIWQAHYMWEAHNVPGNMLSNLVRYIETGLEYRKTHLFGLCLSEIKRTLEKPKIFWDKDEYLKLTRVINRVEGFQREKEEISKKVVTLIENLEKPKEEKPKE